MTSRRRFLDKCCAVVLLVLAVSPVTAPFSTFDFRDLGHSANGLAVGDVKAKGSSDQPLEGLVGLSLLSPLLSPVAGSILASGGDVVTRTILRPVLRL